MRIAGRGFQNVPRLAGRGFKGFKVSKFQGFEGYGQKQLQLPLFYAHKRQKWEQSFGSVDYFF
jgi:hypothetical protein